MLTNVVILVGLMPDAVNELTTVIDALSCKVIPIISKDAVKEKASAKLEVNSFVAMLMFVEVKDAEAVKFS